MRMGPQGDQSGIDHLYDHVPRQRTIVCVKRLTRLDVSARQIEGERNSPISDVREGVLVEVGVPVVKSQDESTISIEIVGPGEGVAEADDSALAL